MSRGASAWSPRRELTADRDADVFDLRRGARVQSATLVERIDRGRGTEWMALENEGAEPGGEVGSGARAGPVHAPIVSHQPTAGRDRRGRRL